MQEQFRAGCDRLCRAIGHDFAQPDLLVQAITHSTYAYEHRAEKIPDNERLEFLGDAVLDLVISDFLFRVPTSFSEGIMTKTRALIVCESTLARVARELELGHLLMLGKGEWTTGGGDKSSNLANAMEAIFGAVYLDAGYDKARTIILALLDEYIQQALTGDMVYDYKSRLLEMVQGTRGNSILRFVIVNEEGPVHDRVFTAAVVVDDRQIATGSGSSKKDAEQKAAREALRYLSCNREGCQILDGEESEE
ncbi:MAG: ribonuclease III [Clostridia bacterium]|nr:ribonuclease III [Clostridia bacterium]NCC74956.1 ribonuclease III [Clostridia bacterium]